MPEHKRVLNGFKWVRPDKGTPIFFLIRYGEELYFVNDSTEALRKQCERSATL